MPETNSEDRSSENDCWKDARVEYFSFTWTLNKFTRLRLMNSKQQTLGTLQFSDSDSSEFSIPWYIEINLLQQETSERTFEICLTRLDSEYKSPISAKFFAVIESKQKKKCDPLSILSSYAIGDKISKNLFKIKSLSDLDLYQSVDKNVTLFCEMAVFKKYGVNIPYHIHGNMPQVQAAILRDANNRIQYEINSNMFSTTLSEVDLGIKVVLIPTVCILTDWIDEGDHCMVHKNISKSPTFYTFLQTIYSELLTFYVEKIINNKLKKVMYSCKILGFQNYIEYLCSLNTAVMRSISVTWMIPKFKNLCNRQLSLYCPIKESGVLFDGKWQLELKFSKNQNQVSIFVHRKLLKYSDFVKFSLNITLRGKVVLEKSVFLHFEPQDKTQGLNNFVTKNESSHFLAENILVLNCSLEIINSSELHDLYLSEWHFLSQNEFNYLERAIDSFKRHGVRIFQNTKTIFIQFLENLNLDFLTIDKLCSIVFENINRYFRIHSCSLCVLHLPQIFYFDLREFVFFYYRKVPPFVFKPVRCTQYIVATRHIICNKIFGESNNGSTIYPSMQNLINIIVQETLPRSIPSDSPARIDNQVENSIAENEDKAQHSTTKVRKRKKANKRSRKQNNRVSSEISDPNGTFEAEKKVQVITEYQPVISTLNTQGNFHPSIIKDTEICPDIGSRNICYPETINGSDNTQHSDITLVQVDNSENISEGFIVESEFENSEETKNSFPEQTNFQNDSNSFHLSNERFAPVIGIEYSGTVYFDTDNQSRYRNINQSVYPETNAAFFYNLHTNVQYPTESIPEMGYNPYSDMDVQMMNQPSHQYSTVGEHNFPSTVSSHFTHNNFNSSAFGNYNQNIFMDNNQATSYPPLYTENMSHIPESTSQIYTSSFQNSSIQYAYNQSGNNQLPLPISRQAVVNYQSTSLFQIINTHYTNPPSGAFYDSNQLMFHPHAENVSHVENYSTASFSSQSYHQDTTGN